MQRPLIDVVSRAAAGGMTLFQLREKDLATGEFIESATGCVEALAQYDVPVLINDRVDVALAAGAAGVHIGQSDIAPEQARRLLGPEALIGLTVRDREELANAPVDILDYLSIGGVFQTKSKNNPRPPIGLDGLTELVAHARQRSALPITAIAGIDSSKIEPVFNCGIDGVAIISAITHATDVTQATRDLRQQVDAALNT